MFKSGKSKPPQENIQSGLRILARLIAREVVNNHLSKVDETETVPPSTNSTTEGDETNEFG